MSPARTVSQLHDLTGRTALVTGGSRGLGLQMAQALAEAGARVLISSRKQGDLDDAAATLRADGHAVDTFAADGRDDVQVGALVDHALATLGPVDILVNNAGATWGAPAQDHPLDAWDKVMDLNVRGVFLLSREVARRSMIPRGQGRIVNVSSIAALGGSGSMQAAAYHASKGAVASLTRALACEWGPHGINVNAILPGVFPSRMARHLLAPGTIEPIVAQLPLRRVGDDEGLKGAVLLLASDAGKHITGVLLPVDGGASAVVGA
ncbi:SDR family oxidoreductase [Ramlibacter sp. Leaf400]|uniref:SDR family oxidoreductase n=1 Tax=Ramlibacter sp. Leaf400 TaxID=1736365 RepID=UPI0006FDAB42|nr:SDR family oxidoreductase [Ramlibacter sp. Leaf400]KQT09727.1 gluconate 5-dehydrogenase [Ramlibacter sp. Leaf400]